MSPREAETAAPLFKWSFYIHAVARGKEEEEERERENAQLGSRLQEFVTALILEPKLLRSTVTVTELLALHSSPPRLYSYW